MFRFAARTFTLVFKGIQRNRFRQEAKNRISGKIKNVAEVSKVQRKIQKNSRRSKTLAENSNLQPNVARPSGKLKSSAEEEKLRRKTKELR